MRVSVSLSDRTSDDWRDAALCLQVGDGDLWFPGKGQNDVVRLAKKVCAHCQVTAECLTWAIDHGETDGIYGGLTPRERRKVKRAARDSSPRPSESRCAPSSSAPQDATS